MRDFFLPLLLLVSGIHLALWWSLGFDLSALIFTAISCYSHNYLFYLFLSEILKPERSGGKYFWSLLGKMLLLALLFFILGIYWPKEILKGMFFLFIQGILVITLVVKMKRS